MRRPLCALALLLTAAVFLALILEPPAAPDYASFSGAQVQVSGTVLFRSYTKSQEDEPVLLVTLGHLSKVLPAGGEQIILAPGQKILCALRPEEESLVPMGARVCVTGSLYAFKEAANPGEFDSRLYYQILRTAFRVSDAAVLSSSGLSHCDRFGEGLCRIRLRLGAVLDQCCTQEDAGILKAMLLGEKAAMSGEMRAVYRDGGILHIVAVSGLHILLMGMGLYRFLRRISALLLSRAGFKSRQERRRFRRLQNALELVCAGIAASLMLCYGKMIGMSPSSFRALFMFGMNLAARQLHRTYDPPTALALSAVMLLLDQPLYLRHSGFLFSFSCVLGVYLLMPYLSGRILKGLAVPLAALPVQLSIYGFFPTTSILLNLAVIPLMSVVMVSGIATLLLGSLGLEGAGCAAALAAHFILLFYHRACLMVSLLPGGRSVPGACSAAAAAVYVLLLLVLIGIQEWKKITVPAAVQLMWLCCCVLILFIRDGRDLRVHMLDVGQGDGIVMQFEGRCILVDGGSSTRQDLWTYQLDPFLRCMGIDTIDLAIVTHDDLDHCSGLIGLLEKDEGTLKPRIGQILLPGISPAMQGENTRRILELAARRKIPVSYLSRGDQLRVESRTGKVLTFFCLHPEPGQTYENANEGSVTLLMQYRDFSMLLTGDLEGAGEEKMTAYLGSRTSLLPVPAAGQQANLTVLKVAHHGSRGSTGESFLERIRPLYALISAGRGNRYGHPHEELLERLEETMSDPEESRIFRTDRSGCITVRTDGETIRTDCFLKTAR